MSTFTHEAASVTDGPLANSVLFDCPATDIILCSQVSKTSVVNYSPILGEHIKTSDSISDADAEVSLPGAATRKQQNPYCPFTFIL